MGVIDWDYSRLMLIFLVAGKNFILKGKKLFSSGGVGKN